MSSIENYTGVYLRSGVIFEAGQQFGNEVRESVTKDNGVWDHKLVITNPNQPEAEEFSINPYNMTTGQIMEAVIKTRYARSGTGDSLHVPIDLETAEFKIQSNNTLVEGANRLLAQHPFNDAHVERRVTSMTLDQIIVPTKLAHASLGSWTVNLSLVNPCGAVFRMSETGEMDVYELHERIKITPKSLEYEADQAELDTQGVITHGLILGKFLLGK